MTVTSGLLTDGCGWRVSEIVCTAGPGDRPYEEFHDATCVALVTAGTFGYACSQGQAFMSSGSLLLGNSGTCYECGHEHAPGDRCISFHFDDDFIAALGEGISPAARKERFRLSRVPAVAETIRLAADIEVCCAEGDARAIGETALRLAGAAFLLDAGCHRPAAPKSGEERRIGRAIRRIEADSDSPLGLAELADEACLSPYHFLRVFRAVTGSTPYQYLLRTRLQRAAVRLRTSEEPVSSVAFAAGFNDLSTFNRRFRNIMGESPGAWRAGRGCNAAENRSSPTLARRT
ncbi:helix-turn-helix transcriptional regulator [Mesorhizobium xinjiangense]|uniref:helix-turn-helix transcriptional regulator n=1 Tax=Mesorhizobium xinjiangense TaxID=2678685 RepID=UPI0012EEA951|nr:helix-turn-helix transcriptional regulator [Mesorhizobium xinjiangense]